MFPSHLFSYLFLQFFGISFSFSLYKSLICDLRKYNNYKCLQRRNELNGCSKEIVYSVENYRLQLIIDILIVFCLD